MNAKNQTLSSEEYYHIYNRANGNEKIFLSEENYLFFLQKYTDYVHPIAETYCYCLMPNHFHFLIKIREEKLLIDYFQTKLSLTFPKFKTLEKLDEDDLRLLLSKQFANFFSSYTQAFNKQQNRKGSLFMKNFKRIKIEEEYYLKKLVHYIHFNPVEATLCTKPDDWKFSPYQALLSEGKSLLNREEVISWFDDFENFKHLHQNRTL